MDLKNQYEKNGWAGPIEVMSRKDALRYKEILLGWDKKLDFMNSNYRCKSNVLFDFVDEITRNSKIIEIVRLVLGPNFHCWDTLFWIKKSGDGKDVSFHQDATYWNFKNPELAVSIWYAFDDVTPEHGSIEYVPGTHKTKILNHYDVKTKNNLLMRGQTVDYEIPKNRIITEVPAGNILVQSPFIIHGSGPNRSKNDRIAMGMVFASTKCEPKLNISPENTMMISGVDEYNYMVHDSKPTGNWEIDVKNWKLSYDRQHDNYFKMC